MKRSVSILGCGWLGIPLGIHFISSGYLVKGSTTSQGKLDELSRLNIHPYLLHFSPGPENEAGDFFSSDVCVVGIPPKAKTNGISFFLKLVQEIAECCKRGKVSHVIFVSSTSVYPSLNRIVAEEDADEESHMRQAENIFRNCGEFKTTIIRFGGLVGPGRHPGKFLAGKKVTGGNEPVNVTHLDDCIAVIDCVIRVGAWNLAINAVSPVHPSRKEFYLKASRSLGVELPIFVEPAVKEYKIVSSEKLIRELNYQFIHPDPLAMIF